MESLETIIIGGGQAGLAAGYHLQQQGRPFVILDANRRAGDAWRKRWDSLRLFTPARYNGLPGMPFPAPTHSIPTKDEMADYLEAYAAHFQLPVRHDVRIDRLIKQDGRFIATAGKLKLEAKNVVVATGAYQRPNVPDFAGRLDPAIRQLHSSEYRNPAQLLEGGVLVVGAGNSGAEIALELSRHHPTWLSGRHPGNEPVRPGSAIDRLVTPLFWFMLSHVVTVNTPIGRKLCPQLRSHGIPLGRVRLPDLAAAGVERVPARTVDARDGRPLLDDGRALDVANVIWCTGFRPDFGWIELPVFDEDGYPRQVRGVATDAPNLYFVGLFCLTAGASALVGGSGRDAAYIAEHIAGRAYEGAAPQVRVGAGQPGEQIVG